MDDTKRKALEALKRGIASQVQQDYKPELDAVEKKGKLKLKNLGIDPDTAARSAASLKLMDDLRQGKFRQKVGDFELEGTMTPKEKALKLMWKKQF